MNRRSYYERRTAVQSGAEARVRATTRIKIKITKINAPAPKSMTWLNTSGFSRSWRRTKPPSRNIGGRLARVTAIHAGR